MSPDAPADVVMSDVPVSPLDAVSQHGFVIGLAGWSGSGKTTLAEAVIANLSARGLTVATVKHAHHRFDADIPGKDSHRHRSAGARQVLVSSHHRSVLFTEHQDSGDRPLADLLASLAPSDIVLVEGFKREPIPKIEVFRAVIGKAALWPEDEWIIALAHDTQTPRDMAAAVRQNIDLLDLNRPDEIADYICQLAKSGLAALRS